MLVVKTKLRNTCTGNFYFHITPQSCSHLGREVDVTRRVDKVDEERRLVDLHVVGLGDTIGGLGGVGGSFSGDLGVLGGLAGALGGLGLELLASDLITASKNHRHTHID